ncbi:23S rRNA (uracil-5-)-methyltransferase RumA [Erysipelotrichaceae bacterium I46]|nr:23S rRNA (uracil(1939)-C(5))-methyltransferase RlmD [[Clostridium] innocuum]ANU68767.1 23S rRNA (uracil-5-)-methyltransferase RumA [Erysipelotrichaceae bacterium I46]ASU18804.1 23S rRNA (uracil(1939)-C(5))-methyltransferase RlmD [[Clostridium] innocuum]QQR27345.1 23S rRNA (uracil(1939)-C(5))-methyltransferase RlmD [[Clostridium] innocuum]
MKVTIKKTGINGEGIGYIDRMPVFVPQALIGEEVEIRIVDKQKRYATAELLRVVKSSKNRIRPKCFIQNTCGACPLMIARYPAQLEYKQDLLKQSLIKYAQIDPRKVARVKASEDVFGYRNQFKLPCAMEEGRLVSGLFMPNSNYFIDVKKCSIHEDGLERVRMDIMHVLNTHGCVSYNPHDKKGIRNLVVRGFDNRYQCTIVTGNDELDERLVSDLMRIKGLTSLWQSIHTIKKTPEVFGNKMMHLAGETSLSMELDGLKLRISPRSFFQLNSKQAVQLYRTIASMVKENNELIVEAYSGIGAISLYLKDKAKEIIGIESIKDAVVNANQNAALNGCEHVSFLCDDAANKLTYLSKKRSIDVLVVDPPRSGLDDAMLECILRSKIKNIIYVSCNPATLGKNLAVLSSRYNVDRIQPIDIFPHTPHVETVVLLSQQKPDDTIEIDLDLDELDATAAETKATYEEIKAYVWDKHHLKVSSLYISQIKRKCGLEVGQNYNLSKSENPKVPKCPPEKEAAIMDALKHFQMI